jgi:hypothetical protein
MPDEATSPNDIFYKQDNAGEDQAIVREDEALRWNS